jgi:release factor glutamine methyltransferase
VTVREALRVAELRLAVADVPSPRVDAELLVAHLLGVKRSAVYAQPEREVEGLEPLLSRREDREPLAYVIGEWGFRGLVLKTDRRALVPRPETETVVERALALIRDLPRPRVLDIGVGSGAIALSIADEHSGARVVGVDTSTDALSLARENAELLGLDLELREGGVETAAEGWDLVVSNPPYVASLEGLEPELRHEPTAALIDAALHGEIARAARTTWLVFEVGLDQASQVADELAAADYVDIRITQDLAGRDRVVEGRRG